MYVFGNGLEDGSRSKSESSNVKIGGVNAKMVLLLSVKMFGRHIGLYVDTTINVQQSICMCLIMV